MSRVPHIDGVITADEIVETGHHIASLQLPTGMIPWFPEGHCDPWNHVETAMALDIAGLHTHAERAYRWTIRTLYLIAVVANLWLLLQTMKETPEGQIMLQRLEDTWDRLRAGARAKA